MTGQELFFVVSYSKPALASIYITAFMFYLSSLHRNTYHNFICASSCMHSVKSLRFDKFLRRDSFKLVVLCVYWLCCEILSIGGADVVHILFLDSFASLLIQNI